MPKATAETRKLNHFAAQYEQKKEVFYQIAYYAFLDRNTAEEIVRESFLQGCRELAGKENITDDFFEILIAQCKKRLKNRNLEEDLPTGKASQADGDFSEILKELSPKARMVLALFMVEGMNSQKIAKLFSMKHNALTEYLVTNTEYVQKAMTGGSENVTI